MKGMIKSLVNYWGDIVSIGLVIVGSVLAVFIWFQLNKVFTRLPKLPIAILSGFVGGFTGFISGILIEGNIESLVKKIRQSMT